MQDLVFMGEDFHYSEETPFGVAILSQTCDLVQASKERCLVAPVLEPTDKIVSDAKKGRKPLHLYLESADLGSQHVADMERATSVPKSRLVGRRLLVRSVEQASSSEARKLGWRIGRAFSRFPFPDEVYPVFNRLRKKAQDRAGSQGAFGQVLDLVADMRVSSDQWASPEGI